MPDLAIVGTGSWGKNLVRNFYELRRQNTIYACDLEAAKLERLRNTYPLLRTTPNYQEILANDNLKAVVIATNAVSHYQLAKQALEAGKDVFVEKPLALSYRQALEVVELAERQQRILMVGHLMLYHPVTQQLRELIKNGELGEIYYIYSQRVNLGQVRRDENALWSFGPHDLSLLFHLLEQEPMDISARGQTYLQEGIEDVVFVSLNFPNRVSAHIHLSWLDPHKLRKVTVVGSKKMAVFDDMATTEKLRIYNNSAEKKIDYDTYGDYITLRFGEIMIPYVTMTEPLKLECQHFLECIEQRKPPRTNGRDGLRVIKALEAANYSLKHNGIPVNLETYFGELHSSHREVGTRYQPRQ
ncbi:MAG: Gfo/Idh/MocA family oxidoreductase [candidate division KSB1 bacterium]|nr:Gfo/Idh/MocA family oxidoreductase [candidate division KSB1 bacterium]MDZ7300835.1 Gfo/Idh/MocA family oxidoreductase [candidate division KSB1 bacterium]MDZ7309894.1 Gfo/Idh/MocA family oxidoreductase [candidate division KSB1 bacterium]